MRGAILITGGGTGGHVYPALSIIRYLQTPGDAPALPAFPPSPAERPTATGGNPPDQLPLAELMYVGSSRGLERRLVPSTGIPAHLFPMAPPGTARGLVWLAMATVRSLVLLLRSRPVAIFATGGYVSLPASVAGWMLRVPLVVFLPDVVPGRAVSFLAGMARRLTVSTEDAIAYLPADKVVVTGYPVREAFLHLDRAAARKRLALPEDERVLLVFGGSQGARSLNQALAPALPELLSRCLVVHVCGPDRLEEAQAAARSLGAQQRARYRLHPFLEEGDMAAALAAADLVVRRSGASVIGELPLSGTPAVLVPLPEGKVHQRQNAEYLARRGVAEIVPDDRLSSDLALTVLNLLDQPERLAEMATSCRALARPDAARQIAEVIMAEAAR